MEQNPRLFDEALQAAAREADELSAEIDHLRQALSKLEARKQAVDDVVHAIRRWVEISSSPSFDPAVFEFPDSERGEVVGLSEEEVSLIAYPDGLSNPYSTK